MFLFVTSRIQSIPEDPHHGNVGAGVLWVAVTLAVALFSPLWTWILYPRWAEIRRKRVRAILLIPLSGVLAAFGTAAVFGVLLAWQAVES